MWRCTFIFCTSRASKRTRKPLSAGRAKWSVVEFGATRHRGFGFLLSRVSAPSSWSCCSGLGEQLKQAARVGTGLEGGKGGSGTRVAGRVARIMPVSRAAFSSPPPWPIMRMANRLDGGDRGICRWCYTIPLAPPGGLCDVYPCVCAAAAAAGPVRIPRLRALTYVHTEVYRPGYSHQTGNIAHDWVVCFDDCHAATSPVACALLQAHGATTTTSSPA